MGTRNLNPTELKLAHELELTKSLKVLGCACAAILANKLAVGQ